MSSNNNNSINNNTNNNTNSKDSGGTTTTTTTTRGNAFSSPTNASKVGLRARRSPSSPTYTSSGAYNKPRTPGAGNDPTSGIYTVRSAEEQEIIGHIASSTGVYNPKKAPSSITASATIASASDTSSSVTQQQVKAALDAATSVLTRGSSNGDSGGSSGSSGTTGNATTGDATTGNATTGNATTGNATSVVSSTTSKKSSSSSPATRRLEAAIAQGISQRTPKPLPTGTATLKSSPLPLQTMPRNPSPAALFQATICDTTPSSTTATAAAAAQSRPPTPQRGMGMRTNSNSSLGGGSVGSTGSRRQSLDLHQNDNAFHVVANLVVGMLLPKLTYNANSGFGELHLTKEDGKHLNQIIGSSTKSRRAFVQAIQHRWLHNCPENSQASVHILTKQCKVELGLGREENNPVLIGTCTARNSQGVVYVADLPPPPGSFTKQTIRGSTVGSSSFAQGGSVAGNSRTGGTSLHHVHSFQNNSESIADTTIRSPKIAVAPNKPPRAPSPRQAQQELDSSVTKQQRLRAREVELLENASIASVLTNPSGTSEQVHGGGNNMMIDNHNPNVSSSESLARKQLLAELREASTLMAESQTPEAAEFWKNHVISLQSRLRSLHADDGNLRVGGNSQQEGQQQQRHQHFSQPTNYSPANYESNEFFTPPLAQGSMEGDPNDPNLLTYTPAAVPPPLVPIHVPPQYQGQHQQQSSTQQYRGGFGGSDPPTPQSQAGSHNSSGMVDVVSPADLPGGYHFEAEIDGRRFLATVPHGGVGMGETFLCDMRPLEIQHGSHGSGKPSVPTGRWRDRLCDWTVHGAAHVVNINAVCCPLLALGQVMTRLQLDVFARPLKVRHDSWRTMRTITIFWVSMNALIYTFFSMKWSKYLPLTIADYVAVTLLNVAMILYTWYAVAATRSHVRTKYNIPEHRFYDLEDNCCATFCLPCTICQLHRHTAPYGDMEALCCTKTGLNENAPLDFLNPTNGGQ